MTSDTLKESRIFKEILRVISLTILIRIVLLSEYSFESLIREIFLEIVIVIVSSFLILSYKLWIFRHVLDSIFVLYESTHKSFKKQLIEFLQMGLHKIGMKIPSAFSEDGVQVSSEEVDFISQLCFLFGNGVYNSTESNVPSVFRKKYPHYLFYHEKNRLKQEKPGIRILLASESALKEDFVNNNLDFEKFKEWHYANSIALLHVDPNRAQDLAKKYSIPSTDIGIWDSNYVAIFKYALEVNNLTLLIRTEEKSKISSTLENCRHYFEDLLMLTKVMKIENCKLIFKDRPLGDKEADQQKVKEQWLS